MTLFLVNLRIIKRKELTNSSKQYSILTVKWFRVWNWHVWNEIPKNVLGAMMNVGPNVEGSGG